MTGDLTSSVLYAAGAGAAALAGLNLAARMHQAPAFVAGVGFFALASALSLSNIFVSTSEASPLWVSEFSGALAVGLFAALWLYLRDLASETPRTYAKADLWHAVLPGLKIALAIAAAPMSAAGIDALRSGAQVDSAIQVFALASSLTTLAVLALPVVYLSKIAWVLWRIPEDVKNAFANLEGRTLTWVRGLAVLALANWFGTIAVALDLLAIPDTAFGALALVQILTMGFWSSYQSPVFASGGRPDSRTAVENMAPSAAQDTDEIEPDQQSGRYERSLLPDERLARIAAKIDLAFDKNRLHLDPNCSLTALSEATGVAANHLSQTFSRKVGKTFFDYVNARRVAEAKRLLQTTTDSVASICYEAGFNSRSSFYNAFRSVTGMTPAEYRASVTDAGT